MATVDRRAANAKKLKDADKIQDQTEESIFRMQRQVEEAKELGVQTLDELRRQGQQINDIDNELAAVSTKLDTSKALQTKFDAWAGNWLGGKRRGAMKEAAKQIEERNKEEAFQVKEVFQQEKYDPLSRKWRSCGLVLCTDTSVSCPELFDPATAEQVENSRWIVDFGLTGIDGEGWTYAYDFNTLNKNGAGDPAQKWNSYVRRRKWRQVDRAGTGRGDYNEITSRNDERKIKLSQASQSRNTDKITFVPRNAQMSGMKESGYASSAMRGARGQQDEEPLDEQSAVGLQRLRERDMRIDAGIDSISRGLDDLTSISGAMKEEVVSQTAALDRVETKMQTATEKQTVVTTRQQWLNKSS